MKLPSLRGTPPEPLIVADHVWLPSIGIPAASWHPIDPRFEDAIRGMPSARAKKKAAGALRLAPAA